MKPSIRRCFLAVVILSFGTPIFLVIRVSTSQGAGGEYGSVLSMRTFIRGMVTLRDIKDLNYTVSVNKTKTFSTSSIITNANFPTGQSRLNETHTSDLSGTSGTTLGSTYITEDPCKDRYVIKKRNTYVLPQQRILYMDGVGRLGNRLFQYASLLGIANRNGFKPLVHSQNIVAQVFDISHVTHEKFRDLSVYFEKAAAKYDECLEAIRHDFDWALGGYYQSWKYFINVQSEVRKELKFKEHIRIKANKTLNELSLKFKGRPKVALHVRRGDMMVKSSIKKGYTIAGLDYFEKAMDYFRRKVKEPVFVVFSEDKSWTKRTFGMKQDVYFAQGDRDSDLATIAGCDHSIISTGSYGWWGAWLAGGETVYYKDFPKNDSWLATQYKADDYFPPSWIGMV